MQLLQVSRTIVETITIKRSESERVEKRVREGLCLAMVPKVDEAGLLVVDANDAVVRVGCDCKAKTRGLCDRHYRLFKRIKASKKSDADANEFEDEQLREGRILGVKDVLKITRPNPFEDV